jgi:hypothetical protein
MRPSRGALLLSSVVFAALLSLSSVVAALATSTLEISTDPFTNTTSQHQTEVEPDTYANGSTIVTVFQQGRFTDGGASDIGFATSQDGGATWTQGSLPGTTTFDGGTLARISDPVVAYDAAHNVWLASGLGINSSVVGVSVTVNRSTDGGLTWANATNVASATGTQNFDKDWITCDDTATSPFYGHCYAEWDDNGNGNLIKMSTSTDGGVTWSAAAQTGNNATGIGGQPLVQPNGTVVVPIANANETAMLSFTSTNGGTSWSSTNTIATRVRTHTPGGGLRSGALPTAAIDGAGRVYVAWEDCRFESGCGADDIVVSTSSNGTTWSAVKRIPIDAVGSGVDHFIPGLVADRSTSGASAHLALAFYYYPNVKCSTSTCQLDVGYVSSTNGGSTWTAKQQIAGPMTLSEIAATTQGPMVGDYMATAIANGVAFPAFAVGAPPSGGFAFNEAMYTVAGGLPVARGNLEASAAGAESAPPTGAAAAASTAR